MTTLRTAPRTDPATAGEHARTTRPGLVRLTRIEVRKLADTRAGMWLLIVMALAAAATTTIMIVFASDEEQTLLGFFQFASLPAGVLLPVLGILSMTSEWSQRTTLTTFTLVPARGRVIAAKLAAGVVIAVAATAVAFGFAAAGTLISGGHSWSITAVVLGQNALVQVASMLIGLGFGALLMNSPVAIVTYLVLPTVWSILGATITSLRPVAEWLDFNAASGPIVNPGVTGGEWARFGVAVALWAGLTLLLGTLRTLRREVA
jgi:ABC-type transport system involved in multi-copper enzyme maturation permease subunit